MVLVKWFGHSAFMIEGTQGKILIDPFLNENPMSPTKAKDIRDVDLILVTHAHNDHLGDSIEIAQNTGARIVAIYELAVYLSKFGIDTVGMNYGGTINIGGIKVSMVPAVHTSTYVDDRGELVSLGNAAGFVVQMDDRKIYHAGDTTLFKDMELIGKLFGPIDLALLPIGGRFVMDVDQALVALDYLKPRYAIPIHYNTWSLIKADPYYFKDEAEKKGIEVFVIKPGESIEI